MISFRTSAARLLALSCAVALSSCATIHADSDYYSAVDFSKYHRYAWVSDSPLIRSQSAHVEISPLTVRRVREAIERVLQSKGFDLAATREDAEFALAFTIGARDMITMNDYPPYYRGVWEWGPNYYGQNIDTNMYTEGMLAVDVFDGASREPVWHGWARKVIVGADIDDPEKTINAAVDAIFADFPPQPK
jgi:hypothetical protein